MSPTTYRDTQLFIGGEWTDGESLQSRPVVDPATGATIGSVALAGRADLERALEAAAHGFGVWRRVAAHERARVMRTAAQLLRERADAMATLLTMEQGKPIAEARAEILNSADTIDWCAEDGRRAYGRVIPSRAPGIYQLVIKEPVGPVAAFTPWNFPVFQIARKLAPALAAGCSVIVKAPEETPASPAGFFRAFADAGLPPGVINLVYGEPEEVSRHLIADTTIRKVSFTGSTAVGKQLAAMAGAHMKRATMELGGHAPVIVFDDVDAYTAARALATSKFRNAGQVCLSPTRFLIQEDLYRAFVQAFVEQVRELVVGHGLDPGTRMGPLANPRRVASLQTLLDDAIRHGGRVEAGGQRVGRRGNFFEPTVVTQLEPGARMMNEEPFAPVAVLNSFRTFDDAVREANRLPYGLGAFAWSRSARTAHDIAAAVDAGMVWINHVGPALPEVPVTGVKDSGYGSEGGSEALEQYLHTKSVAQAGL